MNKKDYLAIFYLQGKRVTVMVWAVFWGEEQLDFYNLARDFEAKIMEYSANSYIEILKDNLFAVRTPAFANIAYLLPLGTNIQHYELIDPRAQFN